MRNIVMVLAVLVAGLVSAPAASAQTATCWTKAGTANYSARGSLLWNYTHTVTWCGDGTTITSAGTPRVEGRALDGTCSWQGTQETRTTPRGAAFETFSMGDFACRTTAGTNGHVNPWVLVTVHPDGKHTVASGTYGVTASFP